MVVLEQITTRLSKVVEKMKVNVFFGYLGAATHAVNTTLMKQREHAT